MKAKLTILLTTVLAAWAPCSSLEVKGQTLPDVGSARRARLVQQYCGAPEILSGPEAEARSRILNRFDPILIGIESKTGSEKDVLVALVDSDEINAHTYKLSTNQSVICLPVGIARFMSDAEGEFAFIIGHEFGHAYDDQCKTQEGRIAAAGGSRVPIVQKRACESRADSIGFEILVAAGYSPFDAAGAFGRLEMFNGDTTTGIAAKLRGMLSDHPITPERIEHLRQLLLQAHQ
jgi:Zn-dependent protease with chaperone function